MSRAEMWDERVECPACGRDIPVWHTGRGWRWLDARCPHCGLWEDGARPGQPDPISEHGGAR